MQFFSGTVRFVSVRTVSIRTELKLFDETWSSKLSAKTDVQENFVDGDTLMAPAAGFFGMGISGLTPAVLKTNGVE